MVPATNNGPGPDGTHFCRTLGKSEKMAGHLLGTQLVTNMTTIINGANHPSPLVLQPWLDAAGMWMFDLRSMQDMPIVSYIVTTGPMKP